MKKKGKEEREEKADGDFFCRRLVGMMWLELCVAGEALATLMSCHSASVARATRERVAAGDIQNF